MSIRDFILERNLLCVRNVGRRIVIPQAFIVIGEFILERNLMSVRNAGRPSLKFGI